MPKLYSFILINEQIKFLVSVKPQSKEDTVKTLSSLLCGKTNYKAPKA